MDLMNDATELMEAFGTDEYSDFNIFKEKVDTVCKDKAGLVSKISPSKKNTILNAFSWYAAIAEKVIKGRGKLTGDKLKEV